MQDSKCWGRIKAGGYSSHLGGYPSPPPRSTCTCRCHSMGVSCFALSGAVKAGEMPRIVCRPCRRRAVPRCSHRP
eukprot:365509-Chlamydomonas_euryale.AAC.1